jgi:uncharacterized membrane protein (DUF373 family)
MDCRILKYIVVELIDSIRVYLEKRGFHLETVISIAIIAMARKVIAVRLRDYEPIMVLGMAALLIALGVNYFLIRKSHMLSGKNTKEGETGGSDKVQESEEEKNSK